MIAHQRYNNLRGVGQHKAGCHHYVAVCSGAIVIQNKTGLQPVVRILFRAPAWQVAPVLWSGTLKQIVADVPPTAASVFVVRRIDCAGNTHGMVIFRVVLPAHLARRITYTATGFWRLCGDD